MPRATLISLLLLSASGVALADPGYYVVSAYDNEGVRSVDFRYWTVKFKDSPATLWPEIGLGYGVTSRWYTELFASYIGTLDTAVELSTLNWQNEFLLTQGEYPFDLAVHASLIKNREAADGYALEYGPVLQTDVGRTQLNANVFFERSYNSSYASGTQAKYQWQIKYRWRPVLQFGLQGFGELGEWDHWAPHDRQSHRAGPAAFGNVRVGEQSISYQAAYLLGSIYGQNGSMFSMRIQYAF